MEKEFRGPVLATEDITNSHLCKCKYISLIKMGILLLLHQGYVLSQQWHRKHNTRATGGYYFFPQRQLQISHQQIWQGFQAFGDRKNWALKLCSHSTAFRENEVPGGKGGASGRQDKTAELQVIFKWKQRDRKYSTEYLHIQLALYLTSSSPSINSCTFLSALFSIQPVVVERVLWRLRSQNPFRVHSLRFLLFLLVSLLQPLRHYDPSRYLAGLLAPFVPATLCGALVGSLLESSRCFSSVSERISDSPRFLVRASRSVSDA